MKPRYSIRVLLGFTAYVAVHTAGLAYPLSWWTDIACVCWFLGILWSGAVAAGTTTPASVFARGYVVGALAYVAVSWIPTEYSTRGVPFVRMPDVWLWLELNPDIDEINIADDANHSLWFSRSMLFARLLLLNTASIAGLICGVWAYWRYVRQERRKSGES